MSKTRNAGLEQKLQVYLPYNDQEAKDRELMLWYLDQFPDLFSRENECAHFTASAWIVDPRRTKVLMAYHHIYQSWSWTGGHMDGGRDFLAAAVREAKEETGILEVRPLSEEIFSLEILGVDGHYKKGKYVAAHLHLNLTYLLEADDRQELQSNPDENSKVAWMSLDEAVAACSEPEMKIIYRKLNEKLT